MYILLYYYIFGTHTRIYMNIFHREKTKTVHIRIINVFPSCYGF